jgi:Dolichyl-phosphate-mannose-protein mannosyltransferase
VNRLHAALAVAAIALVTVVRIAVTQPLFSPTYDEPLHVAAGYEFLAEHTYRTGTDNPPLARAVFAWPLRHAHPTSSDGQERIGEVFESAGDYMRGVVAARRGNLLFVVIALIGVALLGTELFGTTIGVLAAAVFALLPPILAHGGLATTDLPGTAAFAVALWVAFRKTSNALALGAAIAFVFLTKFTFGLFLAIGLFFGVRRPRRRSDTPTAAAWPPHSLALAGVIALALIYAVYVSAHAAPRFLLGMLNVIRLSGRGQDAYLLGEVRHYGWWYYFPLVLAIKTPIALLVLAAIAVWRRAHPQLALLAALMLLVMLPTRSDLGLRHILPIYVPLSVLAAYGIAVLRPRWLAAVLCAWLVFDSAAAHPDYLPWMNALAGPHPERVVLDSNFDWGQDAVRLRTACRQHHIAQLGVALFGTADLRRIGLPPAHAIDPLHASPGWFAVSESLVIPAQVRDPRAYAWLTNGRPFERVGKTIRLYFVASSQKSCAPDERRTQSAELKLRKREPFSQF